MNEYSGYIKLHRSFRNWEWYSDINVRCLYLHLLLIANYKQDTWKGRTYEAGQVIVSRQTLAKAVGLSEQQVRTAMKHLEKTGYITVEATNKFSVITITNWEIYQEDTPNTTYKATVKLSVRSPSGQPQIKNNKNKIIQEIERTPARNAKRTTPILLQTDKYDYEEIRRISRERIRKMINANAQEKREG